MNTVKKIRTFLPLFLILFSSFLALPLLDTEAAVTKPNSWIISIAAVMEGYQPDLEAMSIQAVYNATVPAVSMVADSFYETDIAPNDFVTDGITGTFSSSIASDLSYQSAAGIYQTLKSIDESSFSQYARDQDSTIYTFTTDEDFSTVITNELSDIDPDWTYLNFTCGTMYYVITFDKVEVDKLFAEVKAKDGYALVSDEESTNAQMITTLFDGVFDNHIFDMIHSPINSSLVPSTLTIAEEIEAVLSVNATDTSINGSTKIVHMRNALTGYIGQQLAADSVIEAQGEAYPISNGGLIGFQQTATTYTVYFDVKQDFCTSNTVDENIGAAFTLFQPVDITEGIQVTYAILWAILIGAGVGLVAAVITYAIASAKGVKNAAWISALVFFLVTAITFVIYIVLRLNVSMV